MMSAERRTGRNGRLLVLTVIQVPVTPGRQQRRMAQPDQQILLALQLERRMGRVRPLDVRCLRSRRMREGSLVAVSQRQRVYRVARRRLASGHAGRARRTENPVQCMRRPRRPHEPASLGRRRARYGRLRFGPLGEQRVELQAHALRERRVRHGRAEREAARLSRSLGLLRQLIEMVARRARGRREPPGLLRERELLMDGLGSDRFAALATFVTGDVRLGRHGTGSRMHWFRTGRLRACGRGVIGAIGAVAG